MAKWEDFEFSDEDPTENDDSEGEISFGRKPARIPLAIAFAASLAGCFFASTSTADFVAHLDRQVHDMHCSVVPGAAAAIGESGCRTVMLSPYSSWFRQQYWGGIPISIFALAVFAFMAYRTGHLLWRGRPIRSESGFLFLASCLPAAMTVIYANLAYSEIGEMCNVCIGIYWSSGILLISTVLAVLMSEAASATGSGSVLGRFAVGILEGVAFVAVVGLVYVASIPEVAAGHKTLKGPQGCGVLAQTEDENRVMIDLAPVSGGIPAIELLDPLCPSCRAFDKRLKASGLDKRLSLKAVLFPLDSTCNWMVKSSLHPGACAVSEAMLCAPAEAAKILAWAFEEQEKLLEMGKSDEKKLRGLIKERFPAAKACMGTAIARNKMVRSLRWAVANALTVMTPQLFIDGKRLCDEDTDLGLEYTLSRMTGGVK